MLPTKDSQWPSQDVLRQGNAANDWFAGPFAVMAKGRDRPSGAPQRPHPSGRSSPSALVSVVGVLESGRLSNPDQSKSDLMRGSRMSTPGAKYPASAARLASAPSSVWSSRSVPASST